MLKWNNYKVSNLYPFQLKEKKEKFETGAGKEKGGFQIWKNCWKGECEFSMH